MTVYIIIAALALILLLWGTGVQRRLVSAEEICSNSMSQIGVQQQSRWDAVSTLADLTRSYNEHEYRTLRDVIAQRREIGTGSTAAEANEQEAALGAALRQIKLVAERYPELKADANYARTMDGVNSWEEKVRMSRMVYNDSVTRFNRIVRQFPDSLVAGMLHFSAKDYLKEDAQKASMPKINF